MTRRRRASAFIVLLAATVTGHAQLQPAESGLHTEAYDEPYLQSADCEFEIPEHRRAECAWFYPGEMALGKPVRLPVVRIPGAAHDPQIGPILYVPGGPGYPADLDASGMQQWWQQRDVNRWPQDLWLFDPRGTGQAEPAIDCPEIRALDEALLAEDLSTEQEYKNQMRGARECYTRLLEAGGPGAFNSAHHVSDIEGLMAASQQKNWNIWAVSYGTRTTMHLLRDAPATLRSVILDSAFPPEINGFTSKPEQLQRALDVLVQACAARADCAKAHPALGRQITRLFEQIRAKPIELEFVAWDGLQPVSLVVTELRLLWMLFFETYLTHFDTDTAGAIAHAADGDVSALKPMAQRFVRNLLDTNFSTAVYFSVTCAEDWPGISETEFAEALEENPRVAPYLRPEWQYTVCRFWDAGKLPEQFDKAITSNIPALFLAGEYDPATLPQWADVAAKRMPNATYIEFEGSSHAVTFSNSCAMRSVAAFLQSPSDWQRPACVARQKSGE